MRGEEASVFAAVISGGRHGAQQAGGPRLLAPNVTLLTDGGGKARAALRPITGAAKVARPGPAPAILRSADETAESGAGRAGGW
jgi:hypothetical protein